MVEMAFLRAVLIVLSGFIGIRKHKSAAEDMRRVHPLHVIAAGVCLLAAFIALVLLVVQFVIR